MSVSADTFIVISLMFAVFAAVAAVGTSIVLGAGYERLRAGFEVVRKQTGFFADAIHKLDERTKLMNAETTELKSFVSGLSQKVDRVDAQSGFFVDSLQSLEQKIEDLPQALPSMAIPADVSSQAHSQVQEDTLLPREMDYLISEGQATSSDDIFADMHFEHADDRKEQEEVNVPSLKAVNVRAINPVPANEDSAQPGLSKLLASYFRGGSTQPQDIVYH